MFGNEFKDVTDSLKKMADRAHENHQRQAVALEDIAEALKGISALLVAMLGEIAENRHDE